MYSKIHPHTVYSTDLRKGDYVLVKTQHAFYSIMVLGNGLFRMKGGKPVGARKDPVVLIQAQPGGLGKTIVASQGQPLTLSDQLMTEPVERVWVVPCSRTCA